MILTHIIINCNSAPPPETGNYLDLNNGKITTRDQNQNDDIKQSDIKWAQTEEGKKWAFVKVPWCRAERCSEWLHGALTVCCFVLN